MSTTPQPEPPAPRPPLFSRRLPWLLLLIVLAVVYYGSYVQYGINFHDDGATFALNAKRLLDGERPFLDVELGYNVLWFYPVVGLFKLFGVSFVMLRGYCFALSVLTAVLAFLTVERVSRQAWLAFVVSLLLVVVPGMTFKNYMPLLAVANIWCLVNFALGARPHRVKVTTEEGVTEEYLDVPCAPSWGWLVTGAFVLGLTFLIRIDVGTFFLVIWLGGEWLLALRPFASPGARVAMLVGAPIVTLVLAIAVHVPVYLDAAKRGFEKPFVLRYKEWPAELVKSLDEKLRPAPPALPAPAALSPAPALLPVPPAPPEEKPVAPVVPPAPATPDAGLPKVPETPPALPIPIPKDQDGLPKAPPAPAPEASAPTPPAPPAPATPDAATPPPPQPVPSAPPCAVPPADAPASPTTEPAPPAAPAAPLATSPATPVTEAPAPVTPAPSAPEPLAIAFRSVNGDPHQPESLEFQINTSAMGRGSKFLKLGELIPGTKFKLEKFEAKTAKPPVGEEKDVSELTLINTESSARAILILGGKPTPVAEAVPAPVPPVAVAPAPLVPAPPVVEPVPLPAAPVPAVEPASAAPSTPATDLATTATLAPAAPAAVRLEKEANWNTHGLRPKTLADLRTAKDDSERALILLRYAPLFILIPLAIWALIASLLAWRSNELGAMNRPIAALLAIGGALTIFPQYFFWRSDSPHISEFMPGYWVAAFSAALLLGWSDLRRTSWVARTFASISLLALIAHAGLYLWRMLPDRWTGTIAAKGTFQRKGSGPWKWKARASERFQGANGVDVYVSAKEKPALEELKALVAAHSPSTTDYLAAYPYHPQINLLCDRRTFEKNVYVDNATAGRGWNDAAIARIQKYRPNVIVLSDWDINGTEESRFSVWAEKTKTWIQMNYLFQTKILEFEVYTRPEKEQ